QLLLDLREELTIVGRRVLDGLGVLEQDLPSVGLETLFGLEIVEEDVADGSARTRLVLDVDGLPSDEPLQPRVRHSLGDFITSGHARQDYTPPRKSVKEPRVIAALRVCRSQARSRCERDRRAPRPAPSPWRARVHCPAHGPPRRERGSRARTLAATQRGRSRGRSPPRR